jgi:hypothetical protein
MLPFWLNLLPFIRNMTVLSFFYAIYNFMDSALEAKLIDWELCAKLELQCINRDPQSREVMRLRQQELIRAGITRENCRNGV